jgi:outer membrane receptor protein involved in Fe transport
VNAGANFGIPLNDSLVNKGTGTNYGIELTAEKFFSHTWYALFTTSLFRSTYKGSDGVERSSAFDSKKILNALVGKEFKMNDKNSVALDFRAVWAGGRRSTPINFAASRVFERTIYEEDKAWSVQLRDYIRLDLKIAYKHHVKHVTHELAISAENLTNRSNLFAMQYDAINNRIVELTQLKLFIVGFYRVNF